MRKAERRFREILVLAVGGVLLGCQVDSSHRHWTVTDSAGIRVVQNDPPNGWTPARWSLADSPDVSITQDDADPSAVWSYVRSVFWRPDGSIGLGVADAPFLRVFSPQGVPVLELGSQGEGPGELTASVWAGGWGDSLLILSPRGLAVFEGTGEYQSIMDFPGGEQTHVLATTATGWHVLVRKPYDDDHDASPPQAVAEMAVLRVGLDGQVVDTLVAFEHVPTWRLQDALWGDLRHVESDGERVYIMDSSTWEIQEFVGGDLTAIFRAPVPTLPEFSERHFDAMRVGWGPLADRFLESDREAGRLIIPPAVAMVVDPETGELWVRRTDDGPGSARVWDVFDSGVWTATLETPPQYSIEAVQARSTLGVWTDELGVTGVRVYSVTRRD